ncbi:MAG: hypothetical protein R3236_05460 [Phycisphaeraceae bacterium]|nr:hypothetical protein [Phycisphaeraceae bacterium]
MDMLKKAKGCLSELTEVGLLLVAPGIVLGILFGKQVPFLGGDIIGKLTALIQSPGDNGLVGLIGLSIILYLFMKKDANMHQASSRRKAV